MVSAGNMRDGVVLLCGALTFLGVTPLDPRAVGNIRILHSTGLVRAVVVPCLQQMSTWEAVAAAPLMGLGEALLLMHMQPTWGVWRAGAAAAVWRLVAVGVSGSRRCGSGAAGAGLCRGSSSRRRGRR